MITHLVSILSVLALAFFSQPASAQFLYKSTMPDGKVLYGDAPMPGAVKVEKTKPDTSKKGITAATPKEMAAAKKLEAERAAGAAGAGAVVQGPGAASAGAHSTADLQEMLRKLEADREKFKEPREGERIGTAGGGSRLTEGYWERQKQYDQGVETVRKEIEKRSPGR